MANDWTILFSLPHGLTPGGMTTWALRTAAALAERGRKTVILSHDPAADAAVLDASRLSLPAGITVVSAPAIHDNDSLDGTVAACLRHVPLVYIPSTHEQSFAVAAALALVAPSRVRIIGWNHSDHAYDYDCLAHIEPACSAFVANTSACAAHLRRRMPRRAAEIHQIPHIFGSRIEPRAEKRDDAPLRIGYAGRLEESAKRIGDLIAIASRLRTRNIDFRLFIVGDGPERARLAARITEFNEATSGESMIDLSPPRSPATIGEFWKATDCLLLPSAYEGLSYQLLEAMAAGAVPVVSAIDSGTPDLVENETNGLTFGVGNCDAAADALTRLARDRCGLDRMSRAAQETISHQFDDDRTARLLLDLIDRAVVDRPRAWPPNRPVVMRRTGATTTDTGDEAATRMQAALQRAAALGHRRVAIYGAGRHARSMGGAFADAPVHIIAFVDDDPRRIGTKLWGWPVITREESFNSGLDAVIICSRTNEKQIVARRGEFAAAGVMLMGMYDTGGDASSPATNDVRSCAESSAALRPNKIRTHDSARAGDLTTSDTASVGALPPAIGSHRSRFHSEPLEIESAS